MKKRTVLFLLCIVPCLLLLLAACSSEPAPHFHPLTYRAPKESTCKGKGNIEFWSCEKCDKYFSNSVGDAWSEIGDKSSVFFGNSAHEIDENTYCDVCDCYVGTEGLEYRLNEDGAAYTVTGLGSVSGSTVVVGSYYDGKPVTAIADRAFESCNGLISVFVPSGIETIGKEAFRNCKNLLSVGLGADIQTVGADAFAGCTKMAIVDVASIEKWCAIQFATPYSNPLSLAHSLYESGEYLTTLAISENVTAIGKYAFKGCLGVTEVQIAASVANIGEYAFAECLNLQKVVFAEDCVLEHLTAYAFANCENLTEINIPKYVSVLEKNAFDQCDKVTAERDGVIYVDDWAIGCEEGLKDQVYLLTGTRGIANGAFQNALKSDMELICPASLEVIGKNAFSECGGLKKVTFEANSELKFIGEGAFFRCIGLTDICIPKDVEAICENTFLGCVVLNCVTFLPESSLSRIDGMAFAGCSQLMSVVLPEGISSIGDSAFYGCPNIESVYFEGSTGAQFALLTGVGPGNDSLWTVVWHYYSETAPAEEGFWWHYDNGMPAVWP